MSTERGAGSGLCQPKPVPGWVPELVEGVEGWRRRGAEGRLCPPKPVPGWVPELVEGVEGWRRRGAGSKERGAQSVERRDRRLHDCRTAGHFFLSLHLQILTDGLRQ